MFTQALDRKAATGRVRDPEATRERILECAFDEMYRKGYAGASLDRILADSGVTKGALYHHFQNKAALAVAVIDEVIRPRFLELWVDPVRSQDDPIDALIRNTRLQLAEVDECFVECGCPLNNLSQELSNADELFRTHLNRVFEQARGRLAGALAHGQGKGTVRRDLDPAAIASFILSGLEGLATTLKTSRDRAATVAAAEVFLRLLESLKPGTGLPSA